MVDYLPVALVSVGALIIYRGVRRSLRKANEEVELSNAVAVALRKKVAELEASLAAAQTKATTRVATDESNEEEIRAEGKVQDLDRLGDEFTELRRVIKSTRG